MTLPVNIESLLDEAQAKNLYSKLIDQLNKDFKLANIDLEFHHNILPTSLKLVLQESLYKLIQEKFIDYLNLLYIVDVSERDVKLLDGDDILTLSENVTFLILKREWQKVWYRSKYS